jgi:CheY-like chemotaxis protein
MVKANDISLWTVLGIRVRILPQIGKLHSKIEEFHPQLGLRANIINSTTKKMESQRTSPGLAYLTPEIRLPSFDLKRWISNRFNLLLKPESDISQIAAKGLSWLTAVTGPIWMSQDWTPAYKRKKKGNEYSHENRRIGQGVGLGLHISKQIVELLGGEISIETELGHGSTFSFEIPRRNADPVSLAAPSPQIGNYERQRRKILVVDDEPLNRSVLRELLSTVGLEAAEADSPERAFSLIKNGFDAVISDIRMPGYDGHTFCRSLRSSAETQNLIIIACSGSVYADDQRLAHDSGFSDFLAKPVMEEELFGVLGRHLKLRWTYKQARG